MTGRRLGVIAMVACALLLAVALGGQVVVKRTTTSRVASTPTGHGSPEPSRPPVRAARPAARPSGSAKPATPGRRSPTRPPAAVPSLRTMTGTSAVALTFDDGPTWIWTREMLAVLRQHGVKATFCVIGTMARTYPGRIRQIAADGHTLCNHSDDHDYQLGTRSEAEIRANLQATNDAIRAAVPDARISYFRHPGGAWTPLAVKVAADLGMTSLHWDVDPHDFDRPGPTVIRDYVMSHTRPGSVVLLHDGGGDRSETIEACRQMLPALKDRFQLIPLPPRRSP